MRKLIQFVLLAFTIIVSGCSEDNVPAKNDSSTPEEQNLASSNARSAVGDVVGKVTVGYQGWFTCPGDGSPRNNWVHWSKNFGQVPAPGTVKFEVYPDVREYSRTFQTGLANLGNGQPARLFSSYDNSTVDLHLKWMQQYGIDCAAIQRFGERLFSDPLIRAHRDGIVQKVRNAAQTFGRKFYIMYDISDWPNFQSEIKTDWTNYMKTHTSSGAYARQNGKPVVCIWGPGTSGRPGNLNSWLDVVNWFKGEGCYVILGTDWNWRTQTANLPLYNAANMISPWTVGCFNGLAGADSYVSKMAADLAYLDARNIDFQPVTWPGFAWSNWNGGARNAYPRLHGDFLWRQFSNIRARGIPSAYVAMFDEYDEGTAIAKAAENSSMIPTNQYFLTLDADGIAVSSDFYLRLTGDGARMLKGEIGLTTAHPTSHGSTIPNNYLDRCDATTSWTSANALTVNTIDKKEGTGSLQSVGAGTLEFQKVFSPYNSGVSAATGKIQFWYYVSDVTKLGASNQIEVGSGGTSDVSEYNWNIGTLNNGWNLITKTFSTAGITGGAPNLNSINWFRIYHTKTASVTTKVDGIQILP